jgi:hypothetical protein
MKFGRNSTTEKSGVIYIAPERYFGPDGTVIPYPVEAPQGQDLFIRMTAGDAMPRIYHALVGRNASGKAAAHA